jgi:hypothetical protein
MQTPQHPAKPPSPPPPPPKQPPAAAPAPVKPHDAAHEAKHHEALPIGARPTDPHDPQSAKFERHAGPPDWKEPKPDKEPVVYRPEPALDPRAVKPPAGAYADGMPIADEQRARSAWIEAHGLKAYHEAIDERSDEEKAPKQVPGVTPPTKRE